jgi:hypothetical protein
MRDTLLTVAFWGELFLRRECRNLTSVIVIAVLLILDTHSSQSYILHPTGIHTVLIYQHQNYC